MNKKIESSEENISPKNGVSVKTVLDCANQEREECRKLREDYSNQKVIKLIQQQIGFTEDPVLTGKSEATTGDEPKLTIDSDQLRALGVLFGIDYSQVSAKPAGTFRALIMSTMGGSIEVPVEYQLKPPNNNYPFIISQGLSRELGFSGSKGKITITGIYHNMFSWPNIKP